MADILKPDLCIVGAGPGGLAAAEAARALDATVALVERDRTGGTRLNAGCVPSKALAAAAAHAWAIRNAAPFGMANDQPKVNFRAVHEHVQKTIAAAAPQEAIERYEALGVEMVGGEARFLDRRTLKAGEVLVRARRFILATGSRPVVPDIPGLDQVPFFTTDTIFDNTRKLTHLLVIGADGRALELAQAFRRLGSEVTVVDPGPALAGSDAELADLVLRRIAEEGVALRLGAAVAAIHPRSMGIGVTLRAGEAEEALDISHVLVAGPRRANLDGLGLDKAGVRFDAPGRPRLSRHFRTSNPKIYVIGDAAGGEPSSPLARHQALIATEHALVGEARAARPDLVPRALQTDPELAEIGLTEAEAKAGKARRYKVLRANFAETDRARAQLRGFGAAKLILDAHGRILGAGLVGPEAGEVIALFALALARGLRIDDLADLVMPHPSHAEIVSALVAEHRRALPVSAWRRRMVSLNRLLP